MLCDRCNEFFDSRRSEKLARKYLKLKTDAIEYLRSNLETSQLPQLWDLELNLEDFREALKTQLSPQLPCPWYLGDLSWIPTELMEVDDVELEIWKIPRKMTDILDSVLAGCELCIRLCAITQEFRRLGDPETFELESWLHLDPVKLIPTKIRFFIQGSLLEHDWLYLEINGFNSEDIPLKLQIPEGNSSSDASCFDFMLHSFEDCRRTHSSCGEENSSGWVPTRLIDVGSHTTARDSVRLVERQDLLTCPKRLDYLTLSHVWGNQKFLTLTIENIASFKKEIRIADLRKSFQDAISATRRLNIQYIWIDSLCILQNCLNDWQTEASLMDRVYSHGLCNLAACDASDLSLGFSRPRSPMNGGPLFLSWEWDDYATDFTISYDWFKTVGEYAMLNTRGWVLQERLLSPRTIHFSAFSFWECREMVTCEAYPTKTYEESYNWIANSAKIYPGQFPNCQDALRFWNDVVYTYSRCKLTEEGDKLIALSGIARIFSGFLGEGYLAGIWRQNLLRGLLWEVMKLSSGEDYFTVRFKNYVAPSWSWASVDGPVDPFYYEASVQLAEVISASTISASQDPFGKLVGGELKLRCVLFKVPSVRAISEGKDEYGKDYGIEFDEWAFSFDDYREDFYDIETLFLPLAESPEASRRENLDICGILVQKNSDHGDRLAFQRIGFAIVSRDGDIAGSGWHCDQWITPPWPEHVFQTITVV